MIEQLVRLTAALGSKPVASGAGVKANTKCFAFEAFEDTTISVFNDRNNNPVTTGWEGVQIPAGVTIFFEQTIGSFTVTAGGRGQVFTSL